MNNGWKHATTVVEILKICDREIGRSLRIGLFTSRKSAYLKGFVDGWSLAITSDEGYKYAKLLHNKH